MIERRVYFEQPMRFKVFKGFVSRIKYCVNLPNSMQVIFFNYRNNYKFLPTES